MGYLYKTIDFYRSFLKVPQWRTKCTPLGYLRFERFFSIVFEGTPMAYISVRHWGTFKKLSKKIVQIEGTPMAYTFFLIGFYSDFGCRATSAVASQRAATRVRAYARACARARVPTLAEPRTGARVRALARGSSLASGFIGARVRVRARARARARAPVQTRAQAGARLPVRV